MRDRDRSTGTGAAAQEAPDVIREAAEVAEALLAENETLRRELAARRPAAAPATPSRSEALCRQLRELIANLDRELTSLSQNLERAEQKNRELADVNVHADLANNRLVNLYVATQQLHASLDVSDVVGTIHEVAIDLIGAEVFAVYLLDETSGRLAPLSSEGAEPGSFPEYALGRGVVGEALASGEIWVAPPGGEGDPSRPIACVPLRARSTPVGAIAIHRLLGQKTDITELDRELFDLLTGHAATAISAARICGRSRRRLETVRRFLDLPA